MGFLTAPDDYLTVVKADIFTGLTADDATREPVAQSYAVGIVRGYINSRYNAALLFAATGNARDPVLIQYVVAVSLYKMYASINPKMVPVQREKEYNDTIEFLKAISDGKMNMSDVWPVKTDPQGEVETGFRGGGNEVYNMNW